MVNFRISHEVLLPLANLSFLFLSLKSPSFFLSALPWNRLVNTHFIIFVPLLFALIWWNVAGMHWDQLVRMLAWASWPFTQLAALITISCKISPISCFQLPLQDQGNVTDAGSFFMTGLQMPTLRLLIVMGWIISFPNFYPPRTSECNLILK